MINIKIDNLDNKVKIIVECHGNQSFITKEAEFFITNITKVYNTVIDQLPDYAKDWYMY